jgi:hypothetical protein
MLTRLDFLRFFGVATTGQLFHPPQDPKEPRCFGVVHGVELEIECPPGDEFEVCPNLHRQKPSYTIDLALSREGEEKALVVCVCSICHVLYQREEKDVSAVPGEPSK